MYKCQNIKKNKEGKTKRGKKVLRLESENANNKTKSNNKVKYTK